MIIDAANVELMPGNYGKDCLGNGMHEALTCCCDECDYLFCCVSEDFPDVCAACEDTNCPRKNNEPQSRQPPEYAALEIM